jgi:hypothetical protein
MSFYSHRTIVINRCIYKKPWWGHYIGRLQQNEEIYSKVFSCYNNHSFWVDGNWWSAKFNNVFQKFFLIVRRRLGQIQM